VSTSTVGRIREREVFGALRRPVSRARRGPVSAAFVPLPDAQEIRPVQVGYAIGRRHGNAVHRNNLRRRMRAAVNEAAPDVAPGAYLLAAEPSAAALGYGRLVEVVRQAMGAAADGARARADDR
jgi:ribonuclease P protein component